jgi:hypothetical protein
MSENIWKSIPSRFDAYVREHPVKKTVTLVPTLLSHVILTLSSFVHHAAVHSSCVLVILNPHLFHLMLAHLSVGSI